jgi:hypothetical protein
MSVKRAELGTKLLLQRVMFSFKTGREHRSPGI